MNFLITLNTHNVFDDFIFSNEFNDLLFIIHTKYSQ